MYADRVPPEEPLCTACRVELMECNEDAGMVYMQCRGQVITRFNGQNDVVVDVNHLAVWAAIDGYGIKDRIGVFEKVIRLFHHFLNEAKHEG